jgi:hypothetical protein
MMDEEHAAASATVAERPILNRQPPFWLVLAARVHQRRDVVYDDQLGSAYCSIDFGLPFGGAEIGQPALCEVGRQELEVIVGGWVAIATGCANYRPKMMACSAAIWIGLALRRYWTTACPVAWAGAKIQELKDPALFNWLSPQMPEPLRVR